MNASKDFMKENELVPFISFKDGKAHVVELVSDKKDEIKDGRTGEMVSGIQYTVLENGEKKTFFTSSFSLIPQLAEYNTGDKVSIQMKSKKDASGEFKSYYDVSPAGQSSETDIDPSDFM